MRGSGSVPAIRSAVITDVPALEHAFPAKPHASRVALGRAEYIIAIVEGEPAGHLLLHLDGPNRATWLSYRPPFEHPAFEHPYVEDLFVREDLRRRGIGTALMDEAERRARAAGQRAIGLAVAASNQAGRDLYRRRGYDDAGLAPFEMAGTRTDGRPWREHAVAYLLKRLDQR